MPYSLETDIFPQLARDGRLHGSAGTGYFIDIGTPDSLELARRELPKLIRRPAAFLYYDAPVNVGQVGKVPMHPATWVFSAAEPIRWLNDLGYRVIVMIRYKGAGRTKEPTRRPSKEIWNRLASAGAFIDRLYLIKQRLASKPRSQPNYKNISSELAIIRHTLSKLNSDRTRSVFIGDHYTDIQVAKRAGISRFACGQHDLISTKLLSRLLSNATPFRAPRGHLSPTNRGRKSRCRSLRLFRCSTITRRAIAVQNDLPPPLGT